MFVEFKASVTMLFFALFVASFVFSSAALVQAHMQNVREEQALKQLMQAKQGAAPTAPIAPAKSQLLAQAAQNEALLAEHRDLYAQNTDLVGWIAIQGTQINYPVMYTGDDFYLNHSFEKESTKNGTPYIDKRCSVLPFGTNTIIYAHNMKNGMMFSELLKYKSWDFYEEHPVIRFDTLYEGQNYEIVAVFESEVYQKNAAVFKHYNFLNAENEAAFHEYAAWIQAHSLYDTGVRARYGEKLITLMTCAYHTENGRFVVVAQRCTKEN